MISTFSLEQEESTRHIIEAIPTIFFKGCFFELGKGITVELSCRASGQL
jgi:hypothetical protein